MGSIRIIGGQKRGHRIRVPPGQKVRPMIDRAREAVFNMLAEDVVGRPVWDLFAGSGALGLEALSRGAERAVFVERDPAVVRTLRENIERLGFRDRAEVVRGDVFRWVRRDDIWPANRPLLVFVAPPYALYRDRMPLVVELWQRLVQRLPDDSIVVVQLDRKTDAALLPAGQHWDVRSYGQVRNAVCRLSMRGGGKDGEHVSSAEQAGRAE